MFILKELHTCDVFSATGMAQLMYRMLLKGGTGSGERGAGSGERGAGSGERGTEVWERVVSGNLHKNPKWRSKKRERERRRQRKEFVPWLKSGGDEIANQTHILRLRFEHFTFTFRYSTCFIYNMIKS